MMFADSRAIAHVVLDESGTSSQLTPYNVYEKLYVENGSRTSSKSCKETEKNIRKHGNHFFLLCNLLSLTRKPIYEGEKC